MKQNQNKRDSYIIDEYTQEQMTQAFEFLQGNSKGKGFVVDLKTNRQQLFASTQQQFDSDDYPKNQQDSLEHDFVFLPMVGKTLQTGGSFIKTISPSIFNGGKRVIQNLNKIDDDVGRYIQYQKDKLPLSNNIKRWTTDRINYDSIGDISPALPPVTFSGTIYNIWDNREIIQDRIQKLIYSDDKNNENE